MAEKNRDSKYLLWFIIAVIIALIPWIVLS